MNNVQSGIIGETMRKERRAREKWTATYSAQWGLPLSHPPGAESEGTLLPGPTIRMRAPLPYQPAYVPSAYTVAPSSAAAAADEKAGAGAGSARASSPRASSRSTSYAPYAYIDDSNIASHSLKKATATGPLDPSSDLFVKGDNTIVNSKADFRDAKHSDDANASLRGTRGPRGTSYAFNSANMPAAGIRTRPAQNLLTHTKPNAGAGHLAPAKQKVGAADAAQRGVTLEPAPAAAPAALAAAADARPSSARPVSPLPPLSGRAYGNGNGNSFGSESKSFAATGASDLSASARSTQGSGSFSATRLSGYYAPKRLPSPKPDPNLAAQKSEQLYHALGFKVKDVDQRGVLITKVDKGSAAEASGLRVNDLLAYVNNRPTRNVDEYHAVVAHARGILHLIVRRRGIAKLNVTLKV